MILFFLLKLPTDYILSLFLDIRVFLRALVVSSEVGFKTKDTKH